MSDKFYINLTYNERSRIINSLINHRNSLISQGKYTDGVDDVITKLLSAKKKKFKVITTI